VADVKTILVVDDESDLRVVLCQTLESMGYDTIPAANGSEAAEKAISHQPDLMLLDVMLPDMDGPAVARMLRQNPVTKDLPIIAISAGFDPAIRRNCLAAGCDDFISKPFTYELLADRVRALLA
jgi:CheY-like chemotaxis protein